MTDGKMLLALFEDIDPAAEAIEKLRAIGVADDQMNVISGIPVTEAMLGRPHQWSNVPRLALGGAVAGLLIGVALTIATPMLYAIGVGGQPLIAIPPGIIVVFEMTMLGMLVSTFLGVFLDSQFPSYQPKEYVAEISDGNIAVLFSCPEAEVDTCIDTLTRLGAQSIRPAEAQQL